MTLRGYDAEAARADKHLTARRSETSGCCIIIQLVNYTSLGERMKHSNTTFDILVLGSHPPVGYYELCDNLSMGFIEHCDDPQRV